MKKILGIIAIALFVIGCNMNPNKEARIQKLETEMLQTKVEIEQLKNQIDSIENANNQLKAKFLEVDK